MVGNMSRSNLDKRFFESTRGQIVLLIRAAPKTVNELAADLDLTDNAVRAHLLVLERDGLVEQGSMVKGYRRPHYSYVLIDAARNLFGSAGLGLLAVTLGLVLAWLLTDGRPG